MVLIFITLIIYGTALDENFKVLPYNGKEI